MNQTFLIWIVCRRQLQVGKLGCEVEEEHLNESMDESGMNDWSDVM